jgi:hypothetical protein
MLNWLKKIGILVATLAGIGAAGTIINLQAQTTNPNTVVYGYAPETTIANIAAANLLVVRPASFLLLGTNTANDGGGGWFYWAPGDSSVIDNINVIGPPNGPAGRYKRFTISISLGSVAAGGDLSGTYPNPSVQKINGSAPGPFATGTSAASLTGIISVNVFNNGTNADINHFLRGDGTWQIPPSAAGAAISGSPSAGQVATWTNSTTIQGVNGSTIIPAVSGAVRQTVITGPVSGATGLPSFLPATSGSLSITSQNIAGGVPFVASSANGGNSLGQVDTVCQATSNLTWGGLSANVVNYLYVTISGGICTAGSTTTAPVYEWGGTPSTTNGVFTFNIGAMQAFLGNGATAPQTNIVMVGQATAGSSSITSTAAYAYNGVYDSGYTATLPGTTTNTSSNHNIGVIPRVVDFRIQNTTTELNYSVGDEIGVTSVYSADGGGRFPLPMITGPTTMSVSTGNSVAFAASNKTTGTSSSLTLANWKYRFIAWRGW